MALSTTGARGLPQSPDSVAQLAERLAPVNQKVHGSIPCRVSIFFLLWSSPSPLLALGGWLGCCCFQHPYPPSPPILSRSQCFSIAGGSVSQSVSSPALFLLGAGVEVLGAAFMSVCESVMVCVMVCVCV